MASPNNDSPISSTGTSDNLNEKAHSTGFLLENTSPDNSADDRPACRRGGAPDNVADATKRDLNAKMANPLAGLTGDELRRAGREYGEKNDIVAEEDLRALEVGAILAQEPEQLARIKGLVSAEEMRELEREYTHKFSHPVLLYIVIVMCSVCAAVQGMVSVET
jgi:hypothetical protein